MWKSWLFVSIYGVLILTKQIFSQDVEYYPSQASIDSPRSDHLEFTNVLQSVKENSIIQNVLRKFNDNEKVTIINRNSKRAIDPAFHGHPKTREELWNEYFINESSAFDRSLGCETYEYLARRAVWHQVRLFWHLTGASSTIWHVFCVLLGKC